MPCSWLLERWCQHRVPMATPCWIWQHLKRSILMRINLSRFIHRILNQEQIKKLFLSQLSERLVERTATLLQQFNLFTKVYTKSILFEKWKVSSNTSCGTVKNAAQSGSLLRLQEHSVYSNENYWAVVFFLFCRFKSKMEKRRSVQSSRKGLEYDHLAGPEVFQVVWVCGSPVLLHGAMGIRSK